MSLDNLYPHAGNHSIQNAILAIEWGMQLTLPQLSALRDAASLALPSYQFEEQKSIILNIGPDPNAIPQQTPEVSGYLYSRYSSIGQIAKQVQITRFNCLFIVSDYTRWADLVNEVSTLLNQLSSALSGQGILVAAVGLQYSDRFVWRGQIGNLKLSEVFLTDSPYISPNGLSCADAWHSHHGYLADSGTPVQHKRLDNVNVNVMDEPQGGRAIQILTSHRASLGTPLRGGDIAATIVALEDEMHKVNKDIFKKLLTEELRSKINLSEDIQSH